MKKIILVSILLMLSFASNATILKKCLNQSSDVSQRFVLCVNDNFAKLGKSLKFTPEVCENFGDELNYFFHWCIKGNFDEARRIAGVGLEDCASTDIEITPIRKYVECTNDNFSLLASEIVDNEQK